MAEELVKLLSEEQFDFICEEFELTDVMLNDLSDDDVEDVYEGLADIEVEETMKADEENKDISERGRIASEIVTLWGNVFAEED